MVKTGKRHEALPTCLLHRLLRRLLLPYNVSVLASKSLGKAAQLNPPWKTYLENPHLVHSSESGNIVSSAELKSFT